MSTKRVRGKVGLARRSLRSAEQVLFKVTGGQLTLGRVLRATRLGEDLTQSEFADRLSIAKQQLSDIETGRKLVSVERAYRWAKKLGYAELHWAELALQDMLNKTQLNLRVHLERAA